MLTWSFDRFQDNDVALLFLTSPATGVKTVALPCPTSSGNFAGRAAVIAGYGRTVTGINRKTVYFGKIYKCV